MLTLLSILFWIAVFIGAGMLLARFNSKRYRAALKPDAVHYLDTEDGWRLALSRYRPNQPLPGAPPVLLCPGAGLAGGVFDITPETSLTRFLTHHGYDVWVLDPRGRGGSPRQAGVSWSFDDYVEFDLPAALAHICAESRASGVQCVGAGVGGLSLLVAAAGPATGKVLSISSLGTVAHFRRQQGDVSAALLRQLRRLRLERWLALVLPLLGRVHLGPLRLLYNRDNLDGAVLRRALATAFGGWSPAELLQYAEWLEQDSFTAVVHRRDYRGALQQLTTPLLALVGPRDPVAPADMLEATCELLQEQRERVVVVASRMHGMSTNYGHLDLLWGRAVQRDIHTHLLAWLDEHAGVELPPGRPQPPEPREGWSEPPYPARRHATDDETAEQPPPPDGPDEREPQAQDRVSSALASMAALHRDSKAGEALARESVNDLLGEDEGDEQGDDEEDELDEEDLVQGDVPRVPARED